MFFGAFLIPILAVFLFNCAIFVVVIKVLIQHTFNKSRNTNSKKIKKRLAISIFGIMTLFGLTWIFGIFTIFGASLTFQYLFAIFNSLQGFMIFVFFCVIPKDTRELWIQHLVWCKNVRVRLLSTSTTSKSQVKSGNKNTPDTSSAAHNAALKRLSTQSDLLNLRQSSEDYSSTSVPRRVSLAPISEVEDSSEVEMEMRSTSSMTPDLSLDEQSVSEVFTNPAALESIAERDEEDYEQDDPDPRGQLQTEECEDGLQHEEERYTQ